MTHEKYPLSQLSLIKKKRLEEAEKVLREKKEILTKAEEKLIEIEKKRDEVKTHYQEKLTQLREKLDEGAPPAKITQMKQYLKTVAEDLAREEKKVSAQKEVVKKAEHEVELARQDLFKKQKDVEKLSLHHGEWKKEMRALENRVEERETDEMGNVVHSLKKKEHRHD